MLHPNRFVFASQLLWFASPKAGLRLSFTSFQGGWAWTQRGQKKYRDHSGVNFSLLHHPSTRFCGKFVSIVWPTVRTSGCPFGSQEALYKQCVSKLYWPCSWRGCASNPNSAPLERISSVNKLDRIETLIPLCFYLVFLAPSLHFAFMWPSLHNAKITLLYQPLARFTLLSLFLHFHNAKGSLDFAFDHSSCSVTLSLCQSHYCQSFFAFNHCTCLWCLLSINPLLG